jgi:hypothetical protein
MCTVLLPPGDNPIAVNKYITPYEIKEEKREGFATRVKQMPTAHKELF